MLNHLQQEAIAKYHGRLNSDFPFFAKANLKIRTKEGSIEALVLNEAQTYLHNRLEHQLQATGKIRALILKGRQQGCSTYVGGRFYWHTTRKSGKATFILSHEADTTEKLFQMVERYHANCPEPAKAQTDVANRRRMVFSGLNSEYFVGTAGNENVGRGGTVQYLHASEAAFYPDGDAFSKGLLQSVPDLPGTEVIIESTANGMDAMFYLMCMDAMANRGDYQLIFIPWFWQKEYRRKPPADFVLENSVPFGDEPKIADVYKLTLDQMAWRRNKILELKSLKAFMQEYPCNEEEAFIASGNSLISSLAVMAARKSTITDVGAPLVMGVDPNEAMGRVGISWRRGRELFKIHEIEGRKPMELVNIIATFIDEYNPVKCFIDTGNGYGIVDRLLELGYDDVVVGIGFGDGAIEESLYLNRRTEMWCAFRDWIQGGGVRIVDDANYHKEITCVPECKKTSSGLNKLEPKEIIIQKTKVKPDIADSSVLTFAMPVRAENQRTRRIKKVERPNQSPLKSMRRREGGFKGSNNYASATVKF